MGDRGRNETQDVETRIDEQAIGTESLDACNCNRGA